MAKPQDPQLFHQFRETVGICPQMLVHPIPNGAVEGGIVAFFRAFAEFQFFEVRALCQFGFIPLRFQTAFQTAVSNAHQQLKHFQIAFGVIRCR
jgi:hypothetical protein